MKIGREIQIGGGMIIVPPVVVYLTWQLGQYFVLVMSRRAGAMDQGAAVIALFALVAVGLVSLGVMIVGAALCLHAMKKRA